MNEDTTTPVDPITPAILPSPWLTVREAAQRAKCGRQVLYDAVNSGRLRASRLTSRRELRLRVEWLDAWMESRIVEVNPQLR